MADRIELRGIRGRGRHGVLGAERELGQEFCVDLIAWLDLGPAALSDDLNATVNYAELAELALGVVTGPPLNLIEAVAGRIADHAMRRFPQLHAIEVTVHKPQAPIPVVFADAAVVARRSRKAMCARARAHESAREQAVQGSEDLSDGVDGQSTEDGGRP